MVEPRNFLKIWIRQIGSFPKVWVKIEKHIWNHHLDLYTHSIHGTNGIFTFMNGWQFSMAKITISRLKYTILTIDPMGEDHDPMIHPFLNQRHSLRHPPMFRFAFLLPSPNVGRAARRAAAELENHLTVGAARRIDGENSGSRGLGFRA